MAISADFLVATDKGLVEVAGYQIQMSYRSAKSSEVTGSPSYAAVMAASSAR